LEDEGRCAGEARRLFLFAVATMLEESNWEFCIMSIALPADLQRFVDQQVASGTYGSPDELITTAIQLLREHQARYAQLKADIEHGLQGEGIAAEKVFAELRAKYAPAATK
jgi:putative addiction module CopG family antidote